MEFLADAGSALVASLDYDETLRTLVDLAVPFLAEYSVVFIEDEEGAPLRLAASSHGLMDPAPGRVEAAEIIARVEAAYRPDPADPESIVAQVFRTGRPRLLADLPFERFEHAMADRPELVAALRELEPRSAVFVPLVARTRTVGVMALLRSRARPRYEGIDLSVAVRLASKGGLALQNAALHAEQRRAHGQAREALEQATRLQVLTATLSRAVTEEEVLAALVDQAREALGAGSAAVLELLDEGRISIAHAVGWPVGGPERLSLSDRSLVIDALRTGEPVFAGSPAGYDERYPHLRDFRRELKAEAMAALPLVAKGRTLGVLALGFDEPRDFDDRDRAFAHSLAHHCAEALERARLHREAEEARERAERLATWTGALQNATADLARMASAADVAESLVSHAAAAVGGTRALLLVATPEGDVLELAGALSLPDEVLRRYRRIAAADDAPAARAYRRGEPTLIGSRDEFRRRFPDFREALEATDVHAVAAVPLLAGDRTPLGVLSLGFPTERDFPEEETGWLLALARLGGQALERARLYEGERESRQRAEEAARLREEVLAIVSHDLRTPLQAISAASEVIRLAGDDEDRERQVDLIQRALARMDRLVRDLLDVGRIETGRFRLDRRPLDPAEVVEAAADAFGAVARERGIELRAAIEPGLPAAMMDPDRVEQALSNLIQNAVRHTPAGGTIDISVHREGEALHLAVADDGEGMTPERLERLFDRLWRPREERGEGAGLGLAIARGVVEAHGGRMWAESSPGEGTTVHFSLPIGVPGAADAAGATDAGGADSAVSGDVDSAAPRST